MSGFMQGLESEWRRFLVRFGLIAAIGLSALSCGYALAADMNKPVKEKVNPNPKFEECGEESRTNLPNCTKQYNRDSKPYLENNCGFTIWAVWEFKGCGPYKPHSMLPGEIAYWNTKCPLQRIRCCKNLGRCS